MGIFKDIAVGVFVVVLQVTIFRHLRVFGVEPDVTILLLFYWMAVYPRTRVLILGFMVGFLQDLLLDWWGLAMIAKTVTVMVMYGVVPKRDDGLPTLSSSALYLTMCVVLHQIVMLTVAGVSDTYIARGNIGLYLIGNSLFTIGIGLLAQLLAGRRDG
jgi:rod shape-determining protein MreD